MVAMISLTALAEKIFKNKNLWYLVFLEMYFLYIYFQEHNLFTYWQNHGVEVPNTLFKKKGLNCPEWFITELQIDKLYKKKKKRFSSIIWYWLFYNSHYHVYSKFSNNLIGIKVSNLHHGI